MWGGFSVVERRKKIQGRVTTDWETLGHWEAGAVGRIVE